jgi:hypothetical protein
MEKKSCPECDGMFVPLTGGGLRAHGPVYARCTQDPANRAGTRVCPGCDKAFILTDADEIPPHGPTLGELCPAVSDPAPTVETMDDELAAQYAAVSGFTGTNADNHSQADPVKGPWFGAMYDSKCNSCEDKIYEGDRIRADGEGGYECEECGGDDKPAAAPIVELRIPATPGPMPTPEDVTDAVPLPTPDEFMDPTQPSVTLNVSGQPTDMAKFRDYLGRYAIKDPATGDFRRFKNGDIQGITRVTTFNKAASDSKAINDWNRRNIVIGSALRGDLVIKARGMTHDANRIELDKLAGEFETAAGAKVASSIGTDIHEITERIDAGVLRVEDAPVQYQEQLHLYVEKLAKAGFEPVPGMIERVTAITEFGGVAGMFDRTYYHRPSGTYVIGDVKTGKTMKYSMDETQCQEWIYAHGINQNGVYDLNTHTWEEPYTLANVHERMQVNETVGLIIHMPVQGPDAGKVMLLKADLVKGKAYAELCADVRGWTKSKVVPWSWGPETAAEPTDGVRPLVWWQDQFSEVTTDAQATELWRRAKAVGIQGVLLNDLIEIARQALAGKG